MWHRDSEGMISNGTPEWGLETPQLTHGILNEHRPGQSGFRDRNNKKEIVYTHM